MKVLVIGACNLNDGIYGLARDRALRPPIVAAAGLISGTHTPYVHSVEEAIQFVRYVREEMDLPRDVRRYVFTDEAFVPRGMAGLLDEADLVLFEFSTPLEIEFGAYRLNRNELQRRLVVPLRQAVPALARTVTSWMREGLLKANDETRAAAARLLAEAPLEGAEAPQWQELFREVRARRLGEAEIVGRLQRLRDMFRTRFAVAMPALRYTPDGRGWGWPAEFPGQLEEACAALGLPLLDFDEVVRRYGPAVALMPDLYHHRPDFRGFLDELLRFVRAVAPAAASTASGD